MPVVCKVCNDFEARSPQGLVGHVMVGHKMKWPDYVKQFGRPVGSGPKPKAPPASDTGAKGSIASPTSTLERMAHEGDTEVAETPRPTVDKPKTRQLTPLSDAEFEDLASRMCTYFQKTEPANPPDPSAIAQADGGDGEGLEDKDEG